MKYVYRTLILFLMFLAGIPLFIIASCVALWSWDSKPFYAFFEDLFEGKLSDEIVKNWKNKD